MRVKPSYLIAVGYVIVLLWVSLNPSPIDSQGFIETVKNQILLFCSQISWLKWFGYNQLESLSNVLLYIPLGLYVPVIFKNRASLYVVIVPLVVSVLAELIQGFYLPQRYSTVSDVIANTCGGVIGGFISMSIRHWTKQRALEH